MRITKLGEEILRKVAEPIKAEEINDDFRAFIEEMFEAMKDADGVGLAGPQAGISKRVFVAMADDNVKRVFINPQIIYTSAELCDYEEGCLSIPQVYESIQRPKKVTVQALDENGRPFTLEADGLLARIIQHENDHLDGKLFIDRGDPEFAKATEEQFAKKAAKLEKRRLEKEAKERRIKAKIAAKEAAKVKK